MKQTRYRVCNTSNVRRIVYTLAQITRAGAVRYMNPFNGARFAKVKAESDRLRANGKLVTWECNYGEFALSHCTTCAQYHLAGDICPRNLGI